jgi:uncharacterized membrane protein
METWLIFAIISVFFAGIYNFLMKVISHRSYNISFASMIGYAVASIAAIIFYLYNNY